MIDEFIARRRERWERLEALLALARGHLSASDLEEIGRLYRQVTSDLAIARRDFPLDRVTRYLEQLVGRAHPVVYRREAVEWKALLRFFTHGFPAEFRAAWQFILVAALLFGIPFVFAIVASQRDPLVGRMIVPSRGFVEQIESGQSWLEIGAAERALAASLIMTNNISVAFLAFAGGVALGLGTVYVLVYNGLVLGAVVGLASVYGLGATVRDFVVAHAGIELTVIFIAGGAGLRLGHAILRPGLLSRKTALTIAARRTMRLIFGCAVLLAIAGLIEGFVSPSDLPFPAKAGVFVVITSLMYVYLILAGRTARLEASDRAAIPLGEGQGEG